MFNNFKYNVRRWPNVFALLVILLLADAALDVTFTKHALVLNIVFGLLAGIAYAATPWHVKARVAQALDLFEGRDVCTVAAHVPDEEYVESDETEEQTDEQPLA